MGSDLSVALLCDFMQRLLWARSPKNHIQVKQ